MKRGRDWSPAVGLYGMPNPHREAKWTPAIQEWTYAVICYAIWQRRPKFRLEINNNLVTCCNWLSDQWSCLAWAYTLIKLTRNSVEVWRLLDNKNSNIIMRITLYNITLHFLPVKGRQRFLLQLFVVCSPNDLSFSYTFFKIKYTFICSVIIKVLPSTT